MKKLLLASVLCSLVILGISAVLVPTTAKAGPFSGSQGQVCGGVELQSTTQPCASGTNQINKDITAAINILSIVAGIISVVMIIIGGIKFTTSQGDPGKTSSAKSTILYSLIGLVIAFTAQVIIRYVLKAVS